MTENNDPHEANSQHVQVQPVRKLSKLGKRIGVGFLMITSLLGIIMIASFTKGFFESDRLEKARQTAAKSEYAESVRSLARDLVERSSKVLHSAQIPIVDVREVRQFEEVKTWTRKTYIPFEVYGWTTFRDARKTVLWREPFSVHIDVLKHSAPSKPVLYAASIYL